MRRYGIPASVILAQGILESSNGQSRLALAENNHFGIKATPEWIAQAPAHFMKTACKSQPLLHIKQLRLRTLDRIAHALPGDPFILRDLG